MDPESKSDRSQNLTSLADDNESIGKDEVHLRECCLALLHVLTLSTRSGLPTEVNSNAHEESTLVEEVAGDVHAHQQQEKDNNEDAYDGSRAQAGATARGI